MRAKSTKWLTLIGAILCLVVTVIAGMNVKKHSADYEEVEAIIVSVDKQKVRRVYHYEVVVEYQGKEYELCNLRTEEFARYQRYIGGYTTVYFADGKMYSNVTGVQTDSMVYYIYIGALLGTIVLFAFHIVSVKNCRGKKPKTNQAMHKIITERNMNDEIKDDELMLIKNTVESKCIEHNVDYEGFTFGEYKVDRDNAGCFKRNDRWYFYKNDERYQPIIQGPFSVKVVIYFCALNLRVSKYLPEFEMTDEEFALYCGKYYHSFEEIDKV